MVQNLQVSRAYATELHCNKHTGISRYDTADLWRIWLSVTSGIRLPSAELASNYQLALIGTGQLTKVTGNQIHHRLVM